MLFMNTYEIDESVQRWRNHPTLGPASRTLANLRDCADNNSDGWAFWPKPCRAAKQLQELLQANDPHRREWNHKEPTAIEVKVTYRPIRAFLTRSKLTCVIEEPTAFQA